MAGRWLRSPVITIRDPSPKRVRNIFICIDVAFCASSKTTKAFASVRPRIKASGAISMVFSSISFVTCLPGRKSFSASCWLYVLIDLVLHVARR